MDRNATMMNTMSGIEALAFAALEQMADDFRAAYRKYIKLEENSIGQMTALEREMSSLCDEMLHNTFNFILNDPEGFWIYTIQHIKEEENRKAGIDI